MAGRDRKNLWINYQTCDFITSLTEIFNFQLINIIFILNSFNQRGYPENEKFSRASSIYEKYFYYISYEYIFLFSRTLLCNQNHNNIIKGNALRHLMNTVKSEIKKENFPEFHFFCEFFFFHSFIVVECYAIFLLANLWFYWDWERNSQKIM